MDKNRTFDIVDAMRPIAAKHKVSVARVALAWLLSRKNVMSVIVGAKTEEQLADNIGATALKLDAAELATLDKVSKLRPEYPIWMFERQGQRTNPRADEVELGRGDPALDRGERGVGLRRHRGRRPAPCRGGRRRPCRPAPRRRA